MPLRVVPSSTGLPSKRCPDIGFLSIAEQEIGVFYSFLRFSSVLLSCDFVKCYSIIPALTFTISGLAFFYFAQLLFSFLNWNSAH